MIRNMSLAVVAGLMLVATAPAQTGAWRFNWQRGQVLTYRVEQSMTASETIGGNKAESKTRLNLTKRWQVLDVDAAGVATLQLSVAALRMESTTPSGDVLFFDSANPEKSDAQMKQQMAQYVGQPLAVLRLDGKGRVLEVKESKYGPASKYQNELPFVITLPDGVPQAGQTWEREYKITLDPPKGTGEKYDAVQKCVCKSIKDAGAVVSVAAAVKTLPSAVADQTPLLQTQPEGEVVFDVVAGRLHSVSLQIDKELKNHQGEGSSYHFQSTYVEQYAGGN